MPPTSALFPCGAGRTPAGPGGGGKMCSGAFKRGPERPVGVISLCEGRALDDEVVDFTIWKKKLSDEPQFAYWCWSLG